MVHPPDGGSRPAVVMPEPASGGAIRFTHDPLDACGARVTVVLDTTWTAPTIAPTTAPTTLDRADAGSPVVVSVRDVAAGVLEGLDLIAETSAHLDRWAAASGVIEQLTIRDTSFWFYVRLRHWLWLEERILWAAIVDAIVRAHGSNPIACAPGADRALLDVLRLVAARDGMDLVEEREAEPLPAAPASAPPRPTASRSTGTAPSALRRSFVGRIARRVRNAVLGPPPPTRHQLRQQELAKRLDLVRSHVARLAAEPEARLLVVQEHARQLVDTATGPRWMNPYLDPIVDRLHGTSLDPIVLDIRAHVAQDAAWERVGSGLDPRVLPADALVVASEPVTGPPATERPAGGSSPRPAPAPDPAAPPPIDPALAAWRDGVACPIVASGIDLGPLLAAEVAATASRFLPGMTAAIDQIERFLQRIRPAGLVLADEYHRQDWMTAARSAGIPVAAVQHGMIYPHHNGYIHAARPATLRLPQRTFVFGRWERDLLRTASVYRDDEVVVGGSPRLDLVRPAPVDRSQLRRDLGVADDERLIVVSGTWGGIYRRFHYPIALAALVDRALPGVHIVVKLHPGEPDEGPYRRIIEGAAAARGFAPPKVTTVQSIDLYRLLAVADAHLGIQSTVLTEAVVTRTPNLLASGLAGADLLRYVAAGVALPVRDGGDLLAALDAAAAGALREVDAAAFTAAHFEPGPASERIAADLAAWLA